MTTLSRADLSLLVETLSGASGEPSLEQRRWIALLRRESGEVDPGWARLKALAQQSTPTRATLRELIELQYER